MNNKQNVTLQTIAPPDDNAVASDIWNGSDDNCQGQHYT
jgi:hypothetical protein